MGWEKDVETKLLEQGAFWFILHKIGSGLSRLIFSHGLLVVLVSTGVAGVCNHAVSQRQRRSENIESSPESHDSESYSIVNILINNKKEEGEKNNATDTRESKKNNNKQNECHIVHRYTPTKYKRKCH
ncbi:hypothetical protein WJ752_004603 [Salmonella enterica]